MLLAGHTWTRCIHGVTKPTHGRYLALGWSFACLGASGHQCINASAQSKRATAAVYAQVSMHMGLKLHHMYRMQHSECIMQNAECSAECRMQSAKITECSLLRAPRRIHYSITTSSVCRCTAELDPAIAACTPTLR
jgi:hypothetical protein